METMVQAHTCIYVPHECTFTCTYGEAVANCVTKHSIAIGFNLNESSHNATSVAKENLC